jgi:hypothetical protein
MSTGRLLPSLTRNKLLVHFLFFISLFKSPEVDCLDSIPTIENEIEEINEWIYLSVPTASATSNVSEKCLQHTEKYLTALESRLTWAVQSKLR